MRPLLCTPLLLLSGCLALKSTYHVQMAERTLSQAREYGAQDRALYEYTMALRYLEKAKEEWGYSEYKMSEQMARTSALWSDRAIISIEQRGRIDIRDEDFQPLPAPESAPGAAPAPAPASGVDEWGDPIVPPAVPPPAAEPEPIPPPPPPPDDEFELDEDDE